MSNITEDIRRRLFAMQDEGYRGFQSRLMPGIDIECIIGVRTPKLRRLAKELASEPEIGVFLAELPHRFYEENNLHAFLIEGIKDYQSCVAALDAFLPYVDNWATCDSMSPKALRRNLPELEKHIPVWLAGSTYEARFGIGMLMAFFLDDAFDGRYPEMVAAVRSEQYYVRMMQAWYFATALAKHYDAVLPFLTEHRLERWTHNKAIQKANESRRISEAQSAYLRTLKL